MEKLLKLAGDGPKESGRVMEGDDSVSGVAEVSSVHDDSKSLMATAIRVLFAESSAVAETLRKRREASGRL